MAFDVQRFNSLNYACDELDLPKPFEHAAAARISAGMHVLEIGPGIGRFLRMALQRRAGYVHGIDPREDLFDRLLQRDAECQDAHRLGNLKHTRGEWPESFKKKFTGHFDMVFSQSVIHFLNRSERLNAFRAAHASLRPGGVFALSLKSVDTFWISRKEAVVVDEADNRWKCGDGFVRSFFHIDRLAEELEEAGFAVTQDCCHARPMCGYGRRGSWSTWLELFVTAQYRRPSNQA